MDKTTKWILITAAVLGAIALGIYLYNYFIQDSGWATEPAETRDEIQKGSRDF